MAMPGAERAAVSDAKIADYLLSDSHPVGRFEARFFTALGDSAAAWEVLRDDLLAVARTGEARPGRESPHGEKYEVCATLEGPNGRVANVVTVWIVRHGEDYPDFVTAHPG